MATLRTDRLLLRPWRETDLPAFAALNADPEVMRYFPALLTREESDAFAEGVQAEIEARGWGLWAVEVVGVIPFAGMVGLNEAVFRAPFTPAVEVGWRLAAGFWGRGYATEGARAALRHGFAELGLAEIVSMTAAPNTRSQRVMQRLGMHRDPADDFDHPRVAPGPLRRHHLYRLRREEWQPR